VAEDQDRYQREVDLVPLKRWGEDGVVAGLAIFLASPASAYITGSTTLLDGGLSMVHPINLGNE
jgi:NAD(P)-dependent dehydrogenase (short-subunit alcohol dehydrogenase family)